MPLRGEVRADYIRFIGRCRAGYELRFHMRKSKIGYSRGCNSYGGQTRFYNQQGRRVILIATTRATGADLMGVVTETKSGTGVLAEVKGTHTT